MKGFRVITWIAIILSIIGGINWGLIGVFGFDLIASLFGIMTAVTRIIYILIGISAIYLIGISGIINRKLFIV